jgi:hypothetical protein
MSARVQILTRLRTIQPTIRGSSSQPVASKRSGACNPFHLPFQYRASRAVHVAAGKPRVERSCLLQVRSPTSACHSFPSSASLACLLPQPAYTRLPTA